MKYVILIPSLNFFCAIYFFVFLHEVAEIYLLVSVK